MFGPQEMNISFHHLGADYNIHLVRGGKSDHSVEISGVIYAVLGDKEKLDTACKILNSVFLDSISKDGELSRAVVNRRPTRQVGVHALPDASSPISAH